MTCCADSMCIFKMLNMKMHNAERGCTFCNHITENVEGYRNYTVSSTTSTLCTNEEIKNSMIKEKITKEDTANGIKGSSVLINLCYFDLASGMIKIPCMQYF